MTFLSNHLLLVGLLAAMLLFLLLLAVVISAARRDGDASAGATAGKAPRWPGAASLRLSFRKAVRLIEQNLATRSERYKLAWTLLLTDGEPLALQASGLRSALATDASQVVGTQGVAWHFFDHGIVLQLRSDFLGALDDPAGGAWDDLLGLCRAYRPQRPFDAIVLAIPCAALLQDTPEGQLALVARAKAIQRRLWLAQNRLALRFPVHVVVSQCEAVPGFASFGAAVAESMRRAILGWASPHELAAPFRSAWVDSALDQIVGTVAGACDELCALEPGDADSSAYLALPGELEHLRAGLKLFCEELMRPSAYHEPFLLRGIYLTGDASPAAALDPRGATQDADARAPMPVFLRDVFERKIFAETGLVRTSHQRLRQATGRRLLWWSGLAVPVVWACSLAVGAWALDEKGDALSGYLAAASRAPGQQSALDALEQFEAIGNAPFYSLAMPGSWPVFSNISEDLEAHLETTFARSAVQALNEAARAQAARLTGVVRDPVSGDLLDNSRCTLPPRWEQQVALAPGGLDLRSLPHYAAMMVYLTRLDELSSALGALERLALQGPGAPAPSGKDLALAVRLLLKRELQGTPNRTAALFRGAAQGVTMPAVAPIGMAARCSLRLAGLAMYARLFDDNGLLATERTLVESAAVLRAGTQDGMPLHDGLQLWLALRAAFDAQRRQLVSGEGAWIRQRMVNLGSAQEDVIKRIGANRLLGEDAVKTAREQAAQGFQRFLSAWDNTMTAHSPVDDSAGLIWTDTGWDVTPQRRALHEAVVALVTQPYMRAVAPEGLPLVPIGATVGWDRGQLARAVGLADLRKAFQAGPYTAFPPSLQQPASDLVDLALATSAHVALAQAISAVPPQSASAALDPDRATVLRILAWLDDIDARELAAALRDVLAHDALMRLKRLDDEFQAAQVYMPPDPTFQDWQGGKGVMVDAFGAGDPAGLGAYLEQQQIFIDTIVAQAEVVLADLAGGGEAAGQVARWQALAADLRRYRLKSPTSSRIALETFIATGSADIDLGNCVEKLATRRPARRGGDLFADRLQMLQAGLLARCRALAVGEDQRRWQRFADAYNRDLGMRAPFVQTGGHAGIGADVLPADRDTVGAVMKLYESARVAATVAARDAGQPGPRAEVRRADLQLRRVRDLLAPLYPTEDGQAGGLDVAIDFRANTAAEAGAGNIIEWRLAIGSATLRLGEAPRALRWEPGMPVSLSLRLARDGAVVPKAEPGRPGMGIADRTVSFRFDDPWALLSFINAHRDAGAPGVDDRACLLRFEFALAGAGAGAALPPDSQARVFVRLRVSAPGKATPLAWPTVFPSQVPSWQESANAQL